MLKNKFHENMFLAFDAVHSRNTDNRKTKILCVRNYVYVTSGEELGERAEANARK